MTQKELLRGYLVSGGHLDGEKLEEAAGVVWTMMLSESRGRIQEADSQGPEASLIQQCFNQMADAAAGGEELQSETLGQWTRTRRSGGRTRDQRLRYLLRQNLGETGLLYRGWDG